MIGGKELEDHYEKKIIELKAEATYQKEMAAADKADLQKEVDAIKELQELKTFLKTKKAKGLIKKFITTGLKLDNYQSNVEEFYNLNPFFYDKSGIFWTWNQDRNCYEKSDEIDIMNLIDQQLGFAGQTINSGIRGNYLEAFKRIGRKNLPLNPPKTWVQFKNKIVDLKTLEEREADHHYFFCNPIPWNIGTSTETPTIDKLFTDWQGENKQILYEIIAYCLLTDYPIHTIFAMIGSGRNGKTQYQKIIERFLGLENVTSAELDAIVKERFESAKLYKKLVCSMGETNFGMISKTSMLKKLCGGDLINYEFKNKDPFTGHNYAKIIINTNSLPPSDDTTEGFYRRWIIINWENNFEESGKDIIDIIPEAEYEALAKKSIIVLQGLLDKGRFTNQGSIDERKLKYILASNPLSLFLQERCVISDSGHIKAKDLYHGYLNYLQEKKRRIIKRKEFTQLLAEEGYQAERKEIRNTNGEYENSYWVEGLDWKVSAQSALSAHDSQSEPTTRELSQKPMQNVRNMRIDETNPPIPSFPFEELQNILLDHPEGWSFEAAVRFGFDEKSIRDWIGEGLVFESPLGTLRLV